MAKRGAKKTTNERLQNDVTEMESIMAMLRGQIDEERAKVQPNRPRWAAAAEGPISKFDAHGELARKILSKKKPSSAAGPAAALPRQSPRRAPAAAPPHSIEVIVEPQCGQLWGQHSDAGLQPDGGPPGGSLWGLAPDEEENARLFQEEVALIRGADPQPEPAGGALWGPPPNELEEQMKFQREVARLRGEPPPTPHIESGDQGVGGTIVAATKKPPTAFTYFDYLVTRDILDGSAHIR
jgi:hypothetical protein